MTGLPRLCICAFDRQEPTSKVDRRPRSLRSSPRCSPYSSTATRPAPGDRRNGVMAEGHFDGAPAATHSPSACAAHLNIAGLKSVPKPDLFRLVQESHL